MIIEFIKDWTMPGRKKKFKKGDRALIKNSLAKKLIKDDVAEVGKLTRDEKKVKEFQGHQVRTSKK